MGFRQTKPQLVLSDEDRAHLQRVANARTESAARVQRAKVMLEYAAGKSVARVASELTLGRPTVNDLVNKAIAIGAVASLDELAGRGRPRSITPEARAWLTSVACSRPQDCGYPHELWTTALLSRYIREACEEAGHPSLARLGKGTVSKILSEAQVKPHKIRYYLERRDPDFDAKMAQVLMIYAQANAIADAEGESPGKKKAYVSYDEKPGVQAIKNTAPQLPPVPGKYSTVGRDYEYKRLGTLSIIAGLDLVDGHIILRVEERHRSLEFIEFLKDTDAYYKDYERICIVLDNHSAHASKEVMRFLATMPNRFEFVFTPKHGSWLNLVENLFSKMARSFLRGIRVDSKEELKERIVKYVALENAQPVRLRWSYKLEDIDTRQSL